MKKRLMICITLILVCGFTFVEFNQKSNIAYAEDNLKKYLEEQKSEMDKEMEGMKNIVHTGDAGIDYLYGMIPHHQAAVEMSKSLLKYGGQNLELKKIAENIITSQIEQINQMKDMIKNMESNLKIDKQKEQEYLKEYDDMLDNSMKNDMNSGEMKNNDISNIDSVDKAFATEMIKHHEMAVAMSEIILKFTDNEDVTNLANNIIKSQSKEIKEMKEILNNM